MSVLVVGANGGTGERIVRRLLQHDHHVRAMVRKQGDALPLEAIGAQSVIADLTYDISYALAGCDAVVCAAGAGPGGDPEAVDHRGTLRLVEEAKRQRTGRFILISSLGTSYIDKMPESLRPYLLAKRKAERALEASDLDYTIIKPGGLTDEPGTGKVEVAPTLGKSGTISRDDVAALAAQVLVTGGASRTSFEVIGGDTEIESALEQVA